MARLITSNNEEQSESPISSAGRRSSYESRLSSYELLQSSEQVFLPSDRVRARRLLVTLASVLVVLLFMEALARMVVALGRPAQYGCALFDVKMHIAQSIPTERPALIFIGSSMTNRAVYADLLERKLRLSGSNVSVFNLASTGTYPLDDLLLLQKALDHGVKPCLLVYEINPLSLAMSCKYGDDFSANLKNSFAYPLFRREKEQLLGLAGGGFDVEREFARVSYLVRYRSYLKSKFCALPKMLFQTDAQLVRQPAVKIEEEASEHGYSPEYRFWLERSSKAGGMRTKQIGDMYPFLKTVDRNNLRDPGLERVEAYCRSHNIALVALWLPQQADYLSKVAQSIGLNSEQLAEAIRREAHKNKLGLIDLHVEPDESNLADTAHVNVVGSLKISQRLGQLLSEAPYRNQLFEPAGGAQ